jgi:ElaB/YqjD/DUF883 family membrane-anchored ribosome-binding protein
MSKVNRIVKSEKEVMRALEIAESKFHEAEKEIKKYAKKDPEMAMMIAAGIGTAIGTILTLAIIKRKDREEKL